MKTIYKDYTIAHKLTPNLDYVVDSVVANQEDFGSFMLNASKFFVSKFEALKGVFNIGGKVTQKELSKGTQNILKDLNKEDRLVDKIADAPGSKYLAVSKVLIPYIPGVRVDYYNLVTGIKPHALSISADIVGILEELDTYFSKLAGDDEFRTSLTPEKDLMAKIDKFQQELDKYLVDIMNGKIMEDHRELGDVIPNFTSLKICHNTLKEIISVRDFDKLATIQDLSAKIGSRATDFYKMVNNGSVAVSKVRLKEIKEILPTGAKLVTDTVAVARLVDASIRIHRALIAKLESIV